MRSVSRRRLMLRGDDGEMRNRRLSVTPPPPGKVEKCNTCGRKHRGKCNWTPTFGEDRTNIQVTPFPVHQLEVVQNRKSGNC